MSVALHLTDNHVWVLARVAAGEVAYDPATGGYLIRGEAAEWFNHNAVAELESANLIYRRLPDPDGLVRFTVLDGQVVR